LALVFHNHFDLGSLLRFLTYFRTKSF
jgi:hypothetical protein